MGVNVVSEEALIFELLIAGKNLKDKEDNKDNDEDSKITPLPETLALVF